MPFGKYKGLPIEQIPVEYCAWVLGNVSALHPGLASALRQQIADKQEEFLYFRKSLHSVLLPVGATPPVSVWCQFFTARSTPPPEAAYLLTPATYAGVFWHVRSWEYQYHCGLIKEATLRTYHEELTRMDSYAKSWFDPDHVIRERQRVGRMYCNKGEVEKFCDPDEGSAVYVAVWSKRHGFRFAPTPSAS